MMPLRSRPAWPRMTSSARRPTSSGARPLQHGQPSGQRARRDRVPRRIPEGRRPEDRASGRRRGPPEPRRGPRRGQRRRPHDGVPRPRRHCPRRPLRVDPRSLVRRRRRRLPVGSRRARHEVAGGRGGGRGREPRPRRLATSEWLPEARVRRRRGDRRRRRRAMADERPSRPHPLRHAPQRGRRRRVRVRGHPPLRRVLRREGDLPLQADRARCRRPRLAAQNRRERVAEAGPRPPADRRRQAHVRAHRGPGGAADSDRRRPRRPGAGARANRGRRTEATDDRRADARRDAGPDDGPRLRQDQRDPVAGVPEDRLPCAPGPRRGRRPPADRDVLGDEAGKLEIEFTEMVTGNASPIADAR